MHARRTLVIFTMLAFSVAVPSARDKRTRIESS